jgi:hypothetical protein
MVLIGMSLLLALGGLVAHPGLRGQQPAAPGGDPPPEPQGVEVLARGPVHEAFASLTAEPVPTQPVPRHPPKAIEEMPPEEKPDGDVIWISGYWHYDDDRKDFLWVSGLWRVVPPGKRWVAGYWRDDADQSQWVPGYWAAAAQDDQAQQVTYLPQPPQPPPLTAPGEPPGPDTFYVPGAWVWTGSQYAWRAGYWARVQPGYVWVAAHYRWTPGGYVYIPGYWDLAVSERGILYAPVYVDPAVVTVGYVYTPCYAVPDTLVVDALFVRPCCCHYYFGDYYGPAYREYGFETCVVYSRSHYDGIFVYACYEHRDEPNWVNVQVDICLARHSGRAPCPPRTLREQINVTNVRNVTNITNVTNVTNVKNVTTIMPAGRLAAAKGISTVRLDPAARTQVREHAQAVQRVSYERARAEVATPGGPPKQPHTATLNVPKPHPVEARAAPGAAPSAGRKLGQPPAAAAQHAEPEHHAEAQHHAEAAGGQPAGHPGAGTPPQHQATSAGGGPPPHGPNGPPPPGGVAPGTPPGNHPPGTQPGHGQQPPPGTHPGDRPDPNDRKRQKNNHPDPNDH